MLLSRNKTVDARIVFDNCIATTQCNKSFNLLATSPTPTPTIIPKPAPDSLVTVDVSPVLPPEREPSFEDYLNDGLGSKDFDCDGVENIKDNCILVYNPDQKNSDGDEHGDACDPKNKGFKEKDRRCDIDQDEIFDDLDNCPLACNPKQEDKDKNGVGDVCETNYINKISKIQICQQTNHNSPSINKKLRRNKPKNR